MSRRRAFQAELLIRKRTDSLRNQEVYVSVGQFTMQEFRVCGHEMKHDARMPSGKPVGNGGHKARGERGDASDPHLPRSGIGEKLDVLQALTQVVEDSRSTGEQRATELGRLDPLAVAVQQAHAKGMLQIPD